MDTLDILQRLLAFDTTSEYSNLALIDFVQELLGSHGAQVSILRDPDKAKANLYATIGPLHKPGVLLSGHTDVVPVTGQQWTYPPFNMSIADGKVYGRGSADMKGFVASAIACMIKAESQALTTPLHLALSYDEEIGCVGVRSLIDMLKAAPFQPSMCIVGEPTGLNIANGHKGKLACHVTCVGSAGHSALAPRYINAIHLATDLIADIRDIQATLEASVHDADHEIGFTTLHVGNLHGGVALNIVPDRCQFDFEIRNLAKDDPEQILQSVIVAAEARVKKAQSVFAESSIKIEVFNRYPCLDTPESSDVVALVRKLTDSNGIFKVAFGTEGGLFSSQAGIPTIICGPGSMDQGHKPDEFVTLEQLGRCDQMLDRLLEYLTDGMVS